MDVRLPDGTIIKDVPEGTTRADLAAKLKSNGMAVPSEWLADAPKPQAAESAGSSLREIPRQVGLTARYGIEGLGRLADVATEPIRQMVVNPALRAMGQTPAASTGAAASSLADSLGLPSPQNANERVVGDMARTMAGAGGMAGLSGAAARGATGVTQNVLQSMAARPGVQLAGAAGAGGAGGSVREAGGGPLEQFLASMAGGVAGGAAANKLSGLAESGGRAIKNALTPRSVELANADQQISLTLQRAGVDWSAVPERIKQSMRDEVSQALNSGQPLNADAMRRLLVFKRAEVTPTVGQLTQDPGQITREMNLAKSGANSTSPGLQKLPALQNQNVQSLLRQLDETGAARAGSSADTARAAIGSLDSNVSAAKGNIGSLYNAARDSSGRSLPLDGGAWTRTANAALDEANVGSFLPPDIVKKMNAIATGEYPLTVDVAEQLKTSMGNISRGSADGNVRRALGIVRQALDDAPLQGAQKVNPGNLPAVPGTVPPSTAGAGEESIKAFNAARSANRSFMQRVEGNPALKAVVNGVEPDQFVQKFVIGKGASASDVLKLRDELSPQAASAMRDYLVKHLKDSATNSTDDIAKFSGASYNKALRDLQEKLPAFFSKEEIQKLQDFGAAAKYMQAQPAGSAVNNSNSGALLIGRGLDMLESLSQKLPLGLKDTITGTIQGMQQRQVMAPKNALMLATQKPPNALTVNPLLAGTVVAPVQARENDRRR